MRETCVRRYRGWLVVGSLATLALVAGVAVMAQSPSLPIISSHQPYYARGQNVVPLYRGWFTGSDGRIYAVYDYLNRNSEEILDIPIGSDNAIAPGEADQGQPTHFLPGHQQGVFAVPVPEGGNRELTWTLTIRGQTFGTPSNLGPLYEIEGEVKRGGQFPGNTPPVVRFARGGPPAQGPAGMTGMLTTGVGEALQLDLWVVDDGIPPPPDLSTVIRSIQRRYRRAGGSERGVTVTWTRYRGPDSVSFPNAAPPVEQGLASTTATFAEPGEYMLRALVSDGSGFDGCCWTNSYVAVKVRPAGQ